jgi:MtN3 and saliva related transmembrane protein
MNFITIPGLIAATCTTASFIPQAIKTIQTKDTSGISLRMYSLFSFGTLIW